MSAWILGYMVVAVRNRSIHRLLLGSSQMLTERQGDRCMDRGILDRNHHLPLYPYGYYQIRTERQAETRGKAHLEVLVYQQVTVVSTELGTNIGI